MKSWNELDEEFEREYRNVRRSSVFLVIAGSVVWLTIAAFVVWIVLLVLKGFGLVGFDVPGAS